MACVVNAGSHGKSQIQKSRAASSRSETSVVFPAQENSHQTYLDEWAASDENAYAEYIGRYDRYLALHTGSSEAQIEKCEFIRGSNQDDETDGTDFQACLDTLTAHFPGLPKAVAYRAGFLNGDSAIAFIHRSMAGLDPHGLPGGPSGGASSGQDPGPLYARLAQAYHQVDSSFKALAYARMASLRGDTTDLSLLIAEIEEKDGHREAAVAALLERADSSQAAWSLNQKAEALLRLGHARDAARIFAYARAKPNGWSDPLSHGEALEKSGKGEDALTMYRKAAAEPGTRRDGLKFLFAYQARHGRADSALVAYTRLRDEGFAADPLGRNRLRLFLSHPKLPWRGRDALGILALLGLLMAGFLAPATVIGPVHYAGLLLKSRNQSVTVTQPLPGVWGFTRLWALLGWYLALQLILLMALDYAEIEDVFQAVPKSGAWAASATGGFAYFPDPVETARLFLAYALSMTVLGIFMLRRGGWNRLRGDWSWKRTLISAVVAAGVLRMLSLGSAFPWPGDLAAQTREMLAMAGTYGWPALFVVVVMMGPAYEEIFFRGVILESCERHIGFGAANLLQGAAFSAMHMDKSHALFFLLFGMSLGLLRRWSGGLASGMACHAVFNAVAFGALAYVDHAAPALFH